ncbi:Hypothetical_protein [Hexamita inflata]|uniref:Hypothetical_protein n=1 Tax=Hexamita inflata TaxID=28002 RepID=A0AA86RKJ2_9EUKA|nr:Hypothetical protein HINF_LOCUS61237 [Hexamita inflata]
MFRYTQTDGCLIIQVHGGEKQCQNNLKQFYGKNFNNVNVNLGFTNKSNHYQQSEFILRSYNTLIDQMEVKNCLINLDEATSYFQQVTFIDCTFYGTLSQQFHANTLNFICGITISLFSTGNIKQINLIPYYQSDKINFDNINMMTNLYQLTLQNINLDLSKLNGTWKLVKLINCKLSNLLCINFRTENMYIETSNPKYLRLLSNIIFHNVHFTFTNLNKSDFYELIQKVRYESINLTLNDSNVDLQHFKNHINVFEANSCYFVNKFTSEFSCDKMTLNMCTSKQFEGQQYSDFNIRVLGKLNCNFLNLIYNHIGPHLPDANILRPINIAFIQK